MEFIRKASQIYLNEPMVFHKPDSICTFGMAPRGLLRRFWISFEHLGKSWVQTKLIEEPWAKFLDPLFCIW
jgi:hypothetical protein